MKMPKGAAGICQRQSREAPKGAAAHQFPGKPPTHPLPRARARSPAVGPVHSPATPQAFPCPRAHNASIPRRHPGPPPRAKRRGVRKGAVPMCRRHRAWEPRRDRPQAQQGSAERRSMVDSIHRKIPNPLPWRGPAHSPATPQALPCPRARNTPDRPRHPAPSISPRHHSEPMRREAQEGEARMCREAKQGSAGKRGRDLPGGPAEKRHKAQPG